jgi:hypothetical protein
MPGKVGIQPSRVPAAMTSVPPWCTGSFRSPACLHPHTPFQVPLLVLHGTADDVIHISCARRLVELAGAAAVEPLWAAGYDHQNVETHPDYIPRLRRFLDQLFPPSGAKSAGGAGAVAGAPGSTPRSLSGGGADAAAAVRPQPPGPGV